MPTDLDARSRPRELALPVLAAAVIASACGGEAATTDVAVRDSAGVEIVEHPAAAVEAVPRWDVAADPTLDVGTLEGDPAYQLSGVVGAVTLSDGTLVIAHRDPPEIRFYDADGTHIRTVGSEGEGPGEFRAVGNLLRLEGDTLLVHDWRLSRLSRFAADGSFVDSRRLQGGTAMLRGRLSDGTLLASAAALFGGGGPPEEGTHRRESLLLSYGPDGTLRDTVAARPGVAYHVDARSEGFSVRPVPFTTGPQEAVGQDAVLSGHGRRWELRELGADGVPRRLIRVDLDRSPLTEDVWDERVETRLDAIDDAAGRDRWEEVFRAMERPDLLPAFDAMLLDEEGDLWVREVAEPGASDGAALDRWLVFSPEGRLRAVARAPEELRLLEVGRDRVVAAWTDELDVPHVRVHPLDRSGGRATD